MPELGQLSGLNYRMTFPEQQAYGAQPVVQQQQVEVPEYSNDPIAVREKLTSDYYGNMGLIRSFATDMSKKGINPFQPDYTQEGGGLAFQTMQKLQANLMYSANALGNEFKAEQQLRPLIAQGQVRPEQGVNLNQGMAYSDPNNFYATSLDPIVTQANQELGDARYTQGDSNRLNQAVRDPRVAYFQQQIQKDPNNATYYQRQIDALLTNTPQTAYQQLIPRSGRGNSPEVEVLKKVTNLAQGVWPEGTFSMTTRGGKALLENKTYAGEVMGEYEGTDAKGNPKVYKKILKRWLKDPQTGEVTAEYTDPNIPKEVTSNTTGDVYAAALITNNPKYGDAAKMYSSAREMGLLDDTSSARNEALISQDADTIRQAGQQKASQAGQVVGEKYDVVKNELQKLSAPLFGNNWKTYSLPDGRELQIAKHRNGTQYYIKNWEELGYPSEPKNLPLSDALKYLDDFNYFDKFLGQRPPQQAPQQTGSKSIKSSDIAAKAAAAGYSSEEYTKLLQQKGIQIVDSTQSAPPPVVTTPDVRFNPLEQQQDTTNTPYPHPNKNRQRVEKPEFKVSGKSGNSNIHPWTISVGNYLKGMLGSDLIVNSVYRSREHNKLVGGVTNSFHLDGAALDIKPDDWHKLTAKEKKQLIEKFGLQVVDEGDHIHLEPKNKEILNSYI